MIRESKRVDLCLNTLHLPWAYCMYTYKASNGIQLYNTSWFCCGLLTDDVEHLPNIFLKGKNHFTLFEHYHIKLLHCQIKLLQK